MNAHLTASRLLEDEEDIDPKAFVMAQPVRYLVSWRYPHGHRKKFYYRETDNTYWTLSHTVADRFSLKDANEVAEVVRRLNKDYNAVVAIEMEMTEAEEDIHHKKYVMGMDTGFVIVNSYWNVPVYWNEHLQRTEVGGWSHKFTNATYYKSKADAEKEMTRILNIAPLFRDTVRIKTIYGSSVTEAEEPPEDPKAFIMGLPPVATMKSWFDGDTMSYELFYDGKTVGFFWSTKDALARAAKDGAVWHRGQMWQDDTVHRTDEAAEDLPDPKAYAMQQLNADFIIRVVAYGGVTTSGGPWYWNHDSGCWKRYDYATHFNTFAEAKKIADRLKTGDWQKKPPTVETVYKKPVTEAGEEESAKDFVMRVMPDRPKVYEEIAFWEDSSEEGKAAFQILDEQGEDTAIRYMAQWHYPGEHQTRNSVPWGTADRVHFGKGGYVLSWNLAMGYIALSQISYGEYI